MTIFYINQSRRRPWVSLEIQTDRLPGRIVRTHTSADAKSLLTITPHWVRSATSQLKACGRERWHHTGCAKSRSKRDLLLSINGVGETLAAVVVFARIHAGLRVVDHGERQIVTAD